MQDPIPADGTIARYLRILGVARRPPSMEALSELVRAHMIRIPFENLSKLYHRSLGRREAPGIEEFLDGIEEFHFGGTCFANNGHMNSLLRGLGYSARLCGADMSNPDVHIASIVEVSGREVLVDVGYGAPFLAPLPLDLPEDLVLVHGRDRYVLEPRDAEGCRRLLLYRDGAEKHGYRLKPAPRRIGEFSPAVLDSFRSDATFMNALLLVRFYDDRSVTIHNLTLIENGGEASRLRPLRDREDLIRTVEAEFGIPPEPVILALRTLTKLIDAWT